VEQDAHRRQGAHVEHWLNDVKVVEYELWSPDWEAKVQAAKFKDWPKFGRAKRGHIGLQGDHEGPLAFRNIRSATSASGRDEGTWEPGD
jgi:hypothetical protein